MADCNLSIELDEPARRFRPGQAITGHVVVHVDAPCRCDGLMAQMMWRTHGKGNVDSGTLESVALFAGRWAAGDHQRYPFRLVAPAWPRASRGELLNVDLYVRATADIPWAFDPETSIDVLVVHADDDGLVVEQDVKAHENERAAEGCLAGVFGILALGGAAVATVGISTTNGEAVVGGSIVALIFVALFLVAFRRRFAERKVGRVRVEIEQVAGGGYREGGMADELSCTIRTLAAAEVTSIASTFEVREWVRKGSGTNKKTYTNTLYTTPIALQPAAPGVWVGRVPLPPARSLPYSFSASDNAYQWRVSVHIDIPGWPDWKEELGLVARPRRTGATVGAATNQLM